MIDVLLRPRCNCEKKGLNGITSVWGFNRSVRPPFVHLRRRKSRMSQSDFWHFLDTVFMLTTEYIWTPCLPCSLYQDDTALFAISLKCHTGGCIDYGVTLQCIECKSFVADLSLKYLNSNCLNWFFIMHCAIFPANFDFYTRRCIKYMFVMIDGQQS